MYITIEKLGDSLWMIFFGEGVRPAQVWLSTKALRRNLRQWGGSLCDGMYITIEKLGDSLWMIFFGEGVRPAQVWLSTKALRRNLRQWGEL